MLYNFWSHTTLAVTVILYVLCAGLCVSVCLCVVSMTLFIVSLSARCIVVAEHVKLGDVECTVWTCVSASLLNYSTS